MSSNSQKRLFCQKFDKYFSIFFVSNGNVWLYNICTIFLRQARSYVSPLQKSLHSLAQRIDAALQPEIPLSGPITHKPTVPATSQRVLEVLQPTAPPGVDEHQFAQVNSNLCISEIGLWKNLTIINSMYNTLHNVFKNRQKLFYIIYEICNHTFIVVGRSVESIELRGTSW